jgi:N6-adenosine-specific RNA methylase IME4
MIILPNGEFAAIMADPPIPFIPWSSKGEGRSPQRHYKCEKFDELDATPIDNMAAPACFLFPQVPLRWVFVVEPLMRAWGFAYSGSGFVWAKQNRSGVGWAMGGGYSTRKNAEVCFLGRRGKPQRKSAGVRELIISPRREHSRKPDEIYGRIETLCDGPYLELWARQQWPNWTCVGDEIGKFGAANIAAIEARA